MQQRLTIAFAFAVYEVQLTKCELETACKELAQLAAAWTGVPSGSDLIPIFEQHLRCQVQWFSVDWMWSLEQQPNAELLLSTVADQLYPVHSVDEVHNKVLQQLESSPLFKLASSSGRWQGAGADVLQSVRTLSVPTCTEDWVEAGAAASMQQLVLRPAAWLLLALLCDWMQDVYDGVAHKSKCSEVLCSEWLVFRTGRWFSPASKCCTHCIVAKLCLLIFACTCSTCLRMCGGFSMTACCSCLACSLQPAPARTPILDLVPGVEWADLQGWRSRCCKRNPAGCQVVHSR